MSSGPLNSTRDVSGPLQDILGVLDEIENAPLLRPEDIRERITRARTELGAVARAVGELTQLADLLTEFMGPTILLNQTANSEQRYGQLQALFAQRAQVEAQALRAIQDLRTIHTKARAEEAARSMAEAQQLRAIKDFRVEHRRALKLAEDLREAYLETITALARSVEARDEYTGGHVERVRLYSWRIGAALGLTEEAQIHLEFGAVLHDVGKIGIPDVVLGKAGPLDDAEWAIMQKHPGIGERVLSGVHFLHPALEVVSNHHERWDGKGYPRGLAGEEIPLSGRIVCVADAYDAMTSDRPYRKGLPVEVAVAELEKGKGTHFDPQVIEAFLADPTRLA